MNNIVFGTALVSEYAFKRVVEIDKEFAAYDVNGKRKQK